MESVACAVNSIHWYDPMFRSHGLRSAIADGMWTSRDSPPPYYSNAVTLAPSGLIAAYRQDAIVAGRAANRSFEAVGFSNFVVADGDEDLAMASAVREVARFGTGLPIVGYLAGESLARVVRLGFRTVDPLRIWVT